MAELSDISAIADIPSSTATLAPYVTSGRANSGGLAPAIVYETKTKPVGL
jgi:hypothetical protein